MQGKAGNGWGAFVRAEGTSFLAMVKVAHKAEPYALEKNGKVILFGSFGAANRAAHEHIVDLLNRPMYAESYERKLSEHERLQADVFGAARKGEVMTPEGAFGVLYAKGKNGSSRQVQVVRKRRRARA